MIKNPLSELLDEDYPSRYLRRSGKLRYNKLQKEEQKRKAKKRRRAKNKMARQSRKINLKNQ